MSRETVLARARGAFFVASLVDACTIQHPTGSTTNLATGQVTPTYTSVYTGPCKVGGGDSPSDRDLAEAYVAVLSPVVHIPVDVVGVVEGDLVTITACENDPELVGRLFRVQGPMHASFRSARRLRCTEVTG